LGALLAGAPALAQFTTGFEPPDYQGSADGVPATGQQGWYLPPVAGAIDQKIWTYEGNALGFSANPTGETQFLGNQPDALNDFPRAQYDFDWSASAVWTVSYDVAAKFVDVLPAGPNISSFSLQDSTTSQSFTALNLWLDPTVADVWAMAFNAFDAAGNALPTDVPSDDFINLVQDHWYRESITFDLGSNQILSLSITDLSTGTTVTAPPPAPGWWLQGGANPSSMGFGLPTAFRFFVGGAETSVGNAGAFDNLDIEPASAGAQQPVNKAPGAALKVRSGPIIN